MEFSIRQNEKTNKCCRNFSSGIFMKGEDFNGNTN